MDRRKEEDFDSCHDMMVVFFIKMYIIECLKCKFKSNFKRFLS